VCPLQSGGRCHQLRVQDTSPMLGSRARGWRVLCAKSAPSSPSLTRQDLPTSSSATSRAKHNRAVLFVSSLRTVLDPIAVFVHAGVTSSNERWNKRQPKQQGGAEPAAVKPNWCGHYSYDGGRNCWFETYEQCMAAMSGGNGSCSPSPYSK
jgi:hypothetical protein